MAETKVHIQVNYLPAEKMFRWQLGEAEGKRIALVITPETFAKTVEYLEMVLASYSDARRRGEIE